MKKVIISAIICSHNRAEYLVKAIRSLVNQTISTQEYEIIVVDNKSTDNTKAVVLSDFCHVNKLRYVYVFLAEQIYYP